MEKGTLYPEEEFIIRWESFKGGWIIRGIKHPWGDYWEIENYDSYFLEVPYYLNNGDIIFNKGEKIPKYVKKQFLEMIKARGVTKALQYQLHLAKH